MDNNFTVVFYDMADNGSLAGKTIYTGDDDWFEWQGNYRINRDGTISCFPAYDHRQEGKAMIAGRWYRGH